MKKRLMALLMASVLVFGTSTTVLAAPSSVIDNAAVEEATEAIKDIEIDSEEKATEALETITAIEKQTVKDGLRYDVQFTVAYENVASSYQSAMNITTTQEVAAEVREVVLGATVVGAALNAPKDAVVKTTISAPQTTVEVPETYENAYAVDIELTVNDTAVTELDVPVVVEFTIPSTVDTENLVVLHYHGDETTPVVISPMVSYVGGVNYVSFVVDGFSTFVLANQATPAVPPVQGGSPTYDVTIGSASDPVVGSENEDATVKAEATESAKEEFGNNVEVISVYNIDRVDGADAPTTIVLYVTGVLATDNIDALHYDDVTNEWESESIDVLEIGDGFVKIQMRKFSPIALVKIPAATPSFPWFPGLTQPSTGVATLPKTGAVVVLPFAAMACLAGAVVFGRRK